MQFIKYLKSIVNFMGLPSEQRRVTFYSEGKNYWPYLERLVHETLNTSEIYICYISSENDDPGLFIEHPRYKSFTIGEGFLRNWFFENIQTDIMIMTMPDLNQYQIKRSKHEVHYIYVPHSLVSMHMIYRKGAFDYFDTIFCCGPHHIQEIRAMEAYYKLPPKNLIEYGYSRLDEILEKAKKPNKKGDSSKHVLIAPSWGEKGIIESGHCEIIIKKLLEKKYRVTLRPHPQTIKYASKRINDILKKYKYHPDFFFESNIANQDSFYDSDIMISDWSGAALEYAFGLNKPVLFVNVPKKVNNSEYERVEIEPIESKIRNIIGRIVEPENILKENFDLNSISIQTGQMKNFPLFSLGNSAKIGANFIKSFLRKNYFLRDN